MEKIKKNTIAVIGAGPSGITACIYLARAGYFVDVYEEMMPGGKVNYTASVENYPGFSSISGPDLAMHFYEQMQDENVHYLNDKVVSIRKNGNDFEVITEDQIYLYKATSPSNNAPEINNDTDSNCLVYTRSTKNSSKGEWSKEISTFVTFKSNSLSISYNSFKTGDTYEIIYKKINNNELLNLTSSGEVIYLSDYQNNDSIKSNFAKYIYNNTEKDITIETTSNAFGVSTNNSKTIPAGAIYGYDWMLSNAKVKIN